MIVFVHWVGYPALPNCWFNSNKLRGGVCFLSPCWNFWPTRSPCGPWFASQCREPDSGLHVTGTSDVTCRKYTQNHIPHAKQIWFWLWSQRFCYHLFFRESGFLSFCLAAGSVPGLWFPFAITAHGFGCLGGNQRDQGCWPVETQGKGAPGWHPQATLRWELSQGPGFPGVQGPPLLPAGVPAFSFCVTRRRPLTTILETPRPTWDGSFCSVYFLIPLPVSRLLWQEMYFPHSLVSRSEFPHKVWTFLYLISTTFFFFLLKSYKL